MNALSHYKTKKVSQSCWVSLLLCPVLAHAGPQGAQVVSGQAVVIQSSQGGQSVTTVTQTSNKATLNWQQFNVGPTEIVKFVQPGASSVAINRISDPICVSMTPPRKRQMHPPPRHKAIPTA